MSDSASDSGPGAHIYQVPIELVQILRSMELALRGGVFVVLCLPQAKMFDPAVRALEPISLFYEKEGLSLIVNELKAIEQGHKADERTRMISLTRPSTGEMSRVDLASVISRLLSEKQIGFHFVGACFHDHVFVDADRAEDALQALLGTGD